jgi:hypothetical protein
MAQERCVEEVPEWRQLKTGHWVACHFAEYTPDVAAVVTETEVE